MLAVSNRCLLALALAGALLGCPDESEEGAAPVVEEDAGPAGGGDGVAVGEDAQVTDPDSGGVEDTGGEDTPPPPPDTGKPECTKVVECLDAFEAIGACQEPACVAGKCELLTKEGCCETDADCDDGDPCTSSSCTGPGGECVVEPVTGGCASDADCDDGDPCTTTECADCGVCVVEAVESCCQSAEDCDDGDACTEDSCIAGKCINPPGACCSDDNDCDDENPCTFDFCEEGECVQEPTSECCSGPADCDDSNPCTVDVCNAAAGVCTNTPLTGCCTEDEQCDDQNACTIDTCNDDNQCASVETDTCCGSDADCDDGNACTEGACGDDGQCAFTSVAGCCTDSSDCDDGDPCTADTCFAAQCLSSAPAPGCCEADADCEGSDDENPCTDVVCQDNSCTPVPIPGPCCQSDDECQDGNACTVGACGANGECTFAPVGGCCNTHADCDDKDPCTADVCFANQCVNSAPGTGCCDSAADCEDGNPCTIGTCEQTAGEEAQACVQTPVAGECCASDAECDDNNPCTTGLCLDDSTCSFAPVEGCCDADASCDDGNACTTNTCGPDNTCVSAKIEGCCASAADCDDQNSCTDDACTDQGSCTHTDVDDCCDPASGTEIAHLAFTPNVVDGVQFNPQQGTYRWRENASVAFEGAASMYFGNNNGTGYCQPVPFGGAPSGTATMPVQSNPYPSGVLALPAGGTALVTFQARLDIRAAADVDKLALRVLTAGAEPETVWTKAAIPADQYQSWVPVQVDISEFGGKAVQLQFVFDVTGLGCSGTGPRIDEVRVLVNDCQVATGCQSNADCNAPPNECYAPEGTCSNSGECSYAPSGACCEDDTDCDDSNVCTLDVCILGECHHQKLLACCTSDVDCGTDTPCVVGTCDVPTHKCSYEQLDDDLCCSVDSDCEGADSFCGVACESAVCVSQASDKAQTPLDIVFTEEVDGWEAQPSGGQYRWRETEDEAVSEPRSMYFGDNQTEHYCFQWFGTPSGDAVLPGPSGDNPVFLGGVIAFDASGKTTLKFQVRADVRQHAERDTIAVRLDNGNGQQTVVWTKAALGEDQYDEWVAFEIDLTPHAPFQGQIRFLFDVVNRNGQGGCYNGGTGVYFDDVEVVQTCPAP